jgi:lysophospholipase L1-like esterase
MNFREGWAMWRALLTAAIGLAALAGGAVQAADEFFFQPNDRIVFLGDSITEQYQYSTYLELYLTTRFPDWNLTFINAGISGDTATGGANRFANHVLAEKPTCVTINFGMNDAGYGNFDPNRHKPYVENTTKMLQAAKAAGVRVALLSPNAVDRRIQERFKLYLETQKEFYAPLKDLAAQNGAAFADQYAITRAALEKMEADKADAVKPFGDGFHTSPPGGLLMAHAILTGLKATPYVSSLVLEEDRVLAVGCRCDNVKLTNQGASFMRADAALPLPVQNDWVTLLPYVNHLKDLNFYGLSVKQLTPGTYTVKIDDVDVGEFTAEQLSEGVNLGNVTKGPVFEQANKVFQLINAKNGVVHQRFRGVVMFNIPDWLADVGNERKAAELKKRKDQIDALQVEIYKQVQPVARKWTVQKKS